MEIPGFYYDRTKKKYFRLLPGNNNHNPLTVKETREKKLTGNCEGRSVSDGRNVAAEYIFGQLSSRNMNNIIKNVTTGRVASMSRRNSRVSCSIRIPIDYGPKMKYFDDSCSVMLSEDPGNVGTSVVIGNFCPYSKRKNNPCSVFKVKNQYHCSKFYDACSFGEIGITAAVQRNRDYSIVLLKDGGNNCMLNMKSRPTCIAANSFLKTVAFGGRKYVEILKADSSSHRSVNRFLFDRTAQSLSYCRDGNVLLIGTEKGTLCCCDLRMQQSSRINRTEIPVCNLLLSDVRILDDDTSVITSSLGDTLKLFDLRMCKSIFQFPTFDLSNPDLLRIPFSVDESLGVLCSMCQDGRTRFWNLSDGSLIHSVDVNVGYGVPVDFMALSAVQFSDSWGFGPGHCCLLECARNGFLRTYAPPYF